MPKQLYGTDLGVFLKTYFHAGVQSVMDALSKQHQELNQIGGGDSVSSQLLTFLADKFSWISTGGGASMELLEGKVLPGLAALTVK